MKCKCGNKMTTYYITHLLYLIPYMYQCVSCGTVKYNQNLKKDVEDAGE